MKTLTSELLKKTKNTRRFSLGAASLILFFSHHLSAQDDLQEKIQKLTDAMARTQAQVEQSQRELNEMRDQLTALKQQLGRNGNPSNPDQDAHDASATATSLNTAVDELREQQAMQASQIATHEQAKVESESKYPVKITGLILLNGFINTHAVDIPATPTAAMPGNGNTGASIRQTVLGIEAHGPHLFGARSYADLSVDFNGTPQSSSSATTYYNANATLLRLRTAHAGLAWQQTQAYFSLDRPIFSPDTPTSLTAVAVPALAWSGNLWTWNPQAGIRHDIRLDGGRDLQLEAAVADVADAPLTPQISESSTIVPPVNSGEASRTPGVEAHTAFFPTHIGLAGSRIGAGGYFLRHQTTLDHRFDSWAATLDVKLYLPARLELTGSTYRGLGLGGLGGGGYKDFAYLEDPNRDRYYVRPLNDVGGWMQLKEKWNERLEANAAFGTDNLFAGQMRPYYVPSAGIIANLVRNQTYTGNVIYSPSSYLLFSLEYRHIDSRPVEGASSGSNVIMLGAGYKF